MFCGFIGAGKAFGKRLEREGKSNSGGGSAWSGGTERKYMSGA